jgi:peptide deformylase
VSVRPLRYIGDPVLRTATVPVTAFDAKLAKLVDDLMDSVALAGRAGLAAPQIGVGLAVFSYDIDGRHGYVVNPQVSHTDGGYSGEEACLSLPGAHAVVARAMHAVVTGVDKDGEPVTVEGSGEFARVLQHEVDHLGGTLYVDHLDAAQRRIVMREVHVPELS